MPQKVVEKKFEMSGSNIDEDTHTITTTVIEVSNQKPPNSITVEIK